MSRVPDLVRDSELQTEFRGAATVHSFLEIDVRTGGRFWRKEQWEWDRSLGRGGFGQVNLQRCIGRDTGGNGLRAVKIIEKPMGMAQPLDYNRELEAIAKFSHDRYRRWFVKSYGWFQDSDSVFVTMEYCQNGDLQRFLRVYRRIPAEEVQQLAYQMAEGLDQMHQNDFAHRDLKPGNILIKSMPPDQKWWIVLADFGISKRADENNGPATTVKGTPAFMAPELLGILEDQKPRVIADFKATDMWALGEMIFQMLTGENAFQSPMDLMRYCFGQRTFPYHRLLDSVADDGCQIVSSLMAPIPHSRITTTQCIQHPWVASVAQSQFSAPPTPTFDAIVPHRPDMSATKEKSSWRDRFSSKVSRGLSSFIKPREDMASARWSTLSSSDNNRLLSTVHSVETRTLGAMPQEPRNVDPEPFRRREMSGSPWADGSMAQVQQGGIAAQRKPLAIPPPQPVPVFVNLPPSLQMRQHEIAAQRKPLATPPPQPVPVFVNPPPRPQMRQDERQQVNQELPYKGRASPNPSPSPLHGKTIAQLTQAKGTQRPARSPNRNGREWELVHTLQGHTRNIIHFAFSPDSLHLASTALDSTVRLWDVETGELKNIYRHPLSIMQQVAFSSDSTKLTSASVEDRTLCLWDVETGQPLHARARMTHPKPIVDFKLDSMQLQSRLKDTVLVWNVETGKRMRPVETSQPTSQVVGTKMAIGEPSVLRIWDVKYAQNLRLVSYFGSFRDAVSVLLSPDCNVIACATDKIFKLFDIRSATWTQLSHQKSSKPDRNMCMAFSPDSKLLAATTGNPRVNLWDVETGKEAYTIHSSLGFVITGVAFSPDGRWLALSTENEHGIELHQVGLDA